MYRLSDAIQYLKDRNQQGASAQSLREYTRIANYALSKLRMALKIESDRKKTTLTFSSAYTTGSVVVSGNGVTGTSTVFTSAMIGKFIYFGGETRGYRIATYTSGTILNIEGLYLGGLSNTSTGYLIADRMEVLPTDFRDIDKADQGALQWLLTPLKETEAMDVASMRLRYNYIPRFYGVEYYFYDPNSSAPYTETSSTERRAFLRVYPEPQSACAVDVWYYGGPPTLSSTTDNFGLPNLPEAQTAVEAYLMAELALHRGDVSAYQILSQDAAQWANRLAVLLQPLRDDYPGRLPYRAPDETRFPYKGRFAQGVVSNS